MCGLGAAGARGVNRARASRPAAVTRPGSQHRWPALLTWESVLQLLEDRGSPSQGRAAEALQEGPPAQTTRARLRCAQGRPRPFSQKP